MADIDQEEIERQQEQKRKECRWIAEAIFELAQDDDFEYGISNAAKVLAGVTDETIDQNDLHEHPQYGELADYHHQELKDFISKLADHKLLKKREVGDYAYVIELSSKGEEALEGEELPKIVLPRTVEEYEAANKSSDEISFVMFQDGEDPEEIAEERDLKASTVYSHLEAFVESGDIDPDDLVDPEPRETIRKYIESDAVDLSDDVYLSNIKDALPDKITYDQIKIVLAGYDRE